MLADWRDATASLAVLIPVFAAGVVAVIHEVRATGRTVDAAGNDAAAAALSSKATADATLTTNGRNLGSVAVDTNAVVTQLTEDVRLLTQAVAAHHADTTIHHGSGG